MAICQVLTSLTTLLGSIASLDKPRPFWHKQGNTCQGNARGRPSPQREAQTAQLTGQGCRHTALNYPGCTVQCPGPTPPCRKAGGRLLSSLCSARQRSDPRKRLQARKVLWLSISLLPGCLQASRFFIHTLCLKAASLTRSWSTATLPSPCNLPGLRRWRSRLNLPQTQGSRIATPMPGRLKRGSEEKDRQSMKRQSNPPAPIFLST